MDFELSEEQKMAKRNLRDFLDKEIAPSVDGRDRRGPLAGKRPWILSRSSCPSGSIPVACRRSMAG